MPPFRLSGLAEGSTKGWVAKRNGYMFVLAALIIATTLTTLNYPGVLQHHYYYEHMMFSLLSRSHLRSFPVSRRAFLVAQRCLLDSPFVPDPIPKLLNDPEFRSPKQADLEAHYLEMLNLTAPFRNITTTVDYAGYQGPWVENHWITRFCCNRSLVEFGGMVPLFLRWIDVGALRSGKLYRGADAERFWSALRRDVVYVTVSQHPDGINSIDKHGYHPFHTWNIFVISAGGFGHMPIPLIRGERPIWQPPMNAPPSYKPLFAFAGQTTHLMPMRLRMHAIILELYSICPFDYNYVETVPDWASFLGSAHLALAPRGYGRTSFRLYEILQMGMVPVYVWDDHEWMPYRGSSHADLSRLAFSVQIDHFKDWLSYLNANSQRDPSMSFLNFDERRKRILKVRESHFTYEGVMDQIGKFLKDPDSSDLRCQRHPRTSLGSQLGWE